MVHHMRACDGCRKHTVETEQMTCLSSHVDLGDFKVSAEGCFDDAFYCKECLNEHDFCKSCAKDIAPEKQKEIADYYDSKGR